nr:terpene synthase [Ficus benjamina]
MSFGEAQPLANRPLASFTPSIWGDHFMSTVYNALEVVDNEVTSEKIIELKKEVKKIIATPDQNPTEKLHLIDAVQRLGVSYHFENEIDTILQQFHKNFNEIDDQKYDDYDPYNVALQFRLLREHGYNVPCDVFNKFKDNEGKFNPSLAKDVRGLLSLYEAAQLRVHGEVILDDALVFTTTHLESKASHLSSPLSDQVSHALKHPIRKSLQRREARLFLSINHQDASYCEVLLTFAKLDFNLLQKLYQKELADLTRWWKDLDFKSKLPFSRDRIVECYFWALGVFFEAKHFAIRILLVKVIAVVTTIDDIYDSFGTLEELELFTEAIERWDDVYLINQLPEYMKLVYKTLLDVYSEIQNFLAEGRSYCIDYAKTGLQRQVRAYFQEAKWLHHKQIPTIEEYMSVGLENAGSFLLIAMAFTGIQDFVTKDYLDWILSDPVPKMVKAMSIVGRVMNDIAYHKSDKRRSGCIVASAVECYLKQFGVTEEEAINELTKPVVDAWKNANEECLHTGIPRPLITRVLYLVRVNHEMYLDGDGFTQATLLKDLIASLVINPVPL